MNKEEIILFLHDQHTTLINIQKNIEPLIGDSIAGILDSRQYYFDKISFNVKHLIDQSEMLLRIMRERSFKEYKIRIVSEFIECMSKYMLSKQKFNPPYIFDKLKHFKQFITELKKEAVPNQICKLILKDVGEMAFELSEYFLRESNKLLMATIYRTDELLDDLNSNVSKRKLNSRIDLIELLELSYENARISSDQKNLSFEKIMKMINIWFPEIKLSYFERFLILLITV